VTDEQTDGQTDRIVMAKTLKAVAAFARKKSLVIPTALLT